jgi:glutaredoxin 3
MAAIEIFTQYGCPYCTRALALLSSKGVAFKEIDAPHGSAERSTAKQRSGGRTSVPQIFIDGRHIGGCDDLMALNKAGGLDPLLQAV